MNAIPNTVPVLALASPNRSPRELGSTPVNMKPTKTRPTTAGGLAAGQGTLTLDLGQTLTGEKQKNENLKVFLLLGVEIGKD